jgi:putative transposase
MPWKETKAMDLRVQLIQDYKDGHSISSLAEIYDVSRKTIYKWLARQEEAGVAGLADRSRAPHHSPGKLSDEIIAHIVAARRHDSCGRDF